MAGRQRSAKPFHEAAESLFINQSRILCFAKFTLLLSFCFFYLNQYQFFHKRKTTLYSPCLQPFLFPILVWFSAIFRIYQEVKGSASATTQIPATLAWNKQLEATCISNISIRLDQRPWMHRWSRGKRQKIGWNVPILIEWNSILSMT